MARELKSLDKAIEQGLLLDDEDYHRLKTEQWQVVITRYDSGYIKVFLKKQIEHEIQRHVLGRYLLNIHDISHKDVQCDHINQNPLDNRKENLRFATKRINALNKDKSDEWSSKFKGVHLKRKNRWATECKIQGKRYYIGTYLTEEDAALARDKFLYERGERHKEAFNYPIEYIISSPNPEGTKVKDPMSGEKCIMLERGKFNVVTYKDGVQIYIGRYNTKGEAIKARDDWYEKNNNQYS